jgi:hypothetical protein
MIIPSFRLRLKRSFQLEKTETLVPEKVKTGGYGLEKAKTVTPTGGKLKRSCRRSKVKTVMLAAET